jgi:hypothetical protein
MMVETGTDIIEAPYKELVVGSRSELAPVLPFDSWNPVPIPDTWTRMKEVKDPTTGEMTTEVVPYFVEPKALSKATPKSQRKIHFKGFTYIEASYSIKRLDEYADHGRWTFFRTKQLLGKTWTQLVGKDKKPKDYQEAIVGGWLLVPGLLPVYAEATGRRAVDDEADPMFILTTAYASAESQAIKRAAKRYGIGADLHEEEGEGSEIKAMQDTCDNLFKQLEKSEKTTLAIGIVNKIVPRAIVNDTLKPEYIDEDHVDELLAKLTDAVLAS